MIHLLISWPFVGTVGVIVYTPSSAAQLPNCQAARCTLLKFVICIEEHDEIAWGSIIVDILSFSSPPFLLDSECLRNTGDRWVQIYVLPYVSSTMCPFLAYTGPRSRAPSRIIFSGFRFLQPYSKSCHVRHRSKRPPAFCDRNFEDAWVHVQIHPS